MGTPSGEITRLVTTVARMIRGANGEALRGMGAHAGQESVLEQLWCDDGLTPGDLARRIGVEVPTITRTTQRMEAAGLVRRVRDPDDARLVRITLTDRGRDLRERMPALLDAVAERALRGLSPAERQRLAALLVRVAENLVQGAPSPEP